MYLLLIFLPFFSFLIASYFSRFLGKEGVRIVSIFCMTSTFLLSLFVFFECVLLNSFCYISSTFFVMLTDFEIAWDFYFDTLTCVMLIVINFISLLVHLYSLNYMGEDPSLCRFLSYISLFTFFMIILVTSANLIQMFVGWEGVGLCSYLLISFWFNRIQANKSAIKAVIINRLGDFALTIGIFLTYLLFNTLNYSLIFPVSYEFVNYQFEILNFKFHALSLITFFFFLGSIGKSAQILFHVWLPDAMEGPTPVSALIHAATMVTAGVFFVARFSYLFNNTPVVSYIMIFFGSITVLLSSMVGFLQYDIKRIIAYSTCSQLGYMFVISGLSNYSLSIFHLANHAFFKAALFLCAGSIIHALQNEQDIRKMGGLQRLLPFTYIVMILASIALVGFMYTTGFYSKDVIIEFVYSNYKFSSNFIIFCNTIAISFTCAYSIKILFATFLENPNFFKQKLGLVHEGTVTMKLPLFLLLLGSLWAGYLFNDAFISNASFWMETLKEDSRYFYEYEHHNLSFFVKNIPFLFSVFGLFLFYFVLKFSSDILNRIKVYKKNEYNFIIKLFYTFNRKLYFDKVYNEIFSQYFLKYFFSLTYQTIDRSLLEIFGPKGYVNLFNNLSNIFKNIQKNYIYNYSFFIICFIILFITLEIFYINIFLFNFHTLLLCLLTLLFMNIGKKFVNFYNKK